jgi:hypothetical protein
LVLPEAPLARAMAGRERRTTAVHEHLALRLPSQNEKRRIDDADATRKRIALI